MIRPCSCLVVGPELVIQYCARSTQMVTHAKGTPRSRRARFLYLMHSIRHHHPHGMARKQEISEKRPIDQVPHGKPRGQISFTVKPGGSDCFSLSAFSRSFTQRVYKYLLHRTLNFTTSFDFFIFTAALWERARTQLDVCSLHRAQPMYSAEAAEGRK